MSHPKIENQVDVIRHEDREGAVPDFLFITESDGFHDRMAGFVLAEHVFATDLRTTGDENVGESEQEKSGDSWLRRFRMDRNQAVAGYSLVNPAPA
jgi:hypothetical protein